VPCVQFVGPQLLPPSEAAAASGRVVVASPVPASELEVEVASAEPDAPPSGASTGGEPSGDASALEGRSAAHPASAKAIATASRRIEEITSLKGYATRGGTPPAVHSRKTVTVGARQAEGAAAANFTPRPRRSTWRNSPRSRARSRGRGACSASYSSTPPAPSSLSRGVLWDTSRNARCSPTSFTDKKSRCVTADGARVNDLGFVVYADTTCTSMTAAAPSASGNGGSCPLPPPAARQLPAFRSQSGPGNLESNHEALCQRRLHDFSRPPMESVRRDRVDQSMPVSVPASAPASVSASVPES
jgi:hypothetical protein